MVAICRFLTKTYKESLWSKEREIRHMQLAVLTLSSMKGNNSSLQGPRFQGTVINYESLLTFAICLAQVIRNVFSNQGSCDSNDYNHRNDNRDDHNFSSRS